MEDRARMRVSWTVKDRSALIKRIARPSSDSTAGTSSPQVHNVLDSLHHLLLSKDKQIERDARELALLRHTLLEMDEKLRRLSPPSPGGGGSYLSKLHQQPKSFHVSALTSSGPSMIPTGQTLRSMAMPVAVPSSIPMSPGPTNSSASSAPSAYSTTSSPPSITITSTSSSRSIENMPSASAALARKDNEVLQLQNQLSTLLASLETARLQSRESQDKMYDLQTRLSRCESDQKAQVVQLVTERERVRGLLEERDTARERLDKVKNTLFSVV